MALQSESALAMATLGVLGDTPVDPLQPPLVDAIHLRWAFGQTRSFPWFGYYLFRRRHRDKGKEICVRGHFRELAPPTHTPGVSSIPQSLNSPIHITAAGIFTSDQNLVVTDDFPDPFFGELDLRNRNFLRFTCAEPARRIRYRVGLRKEEGGGHLTCVRFETVDVGNISNPRVKDNVTFTVFDHNGQQKPESRVRPVAGGVALDMGFSTRIDLPCAADRVVILATNSASPGKIRALKGNGQEVDSQPFDRSEQAPVQVVLQGKGIRRLEVIAPQNEAMLLSLCYHCAEEGRETPSTGSSGISVVGGADSLTAHAAPGKLAVRFYSGTTLLHEEAINGNPGDIVEGEYSADSLTAIEFTGGNAAVIDICYLTVRSLLQGGWKPVEKCPQPIALPVRDTDYPASGAQPVNLAASRAEALGRIRYGTPTDWTNQFNEMHPALHNMVNAGPGGPAMKDVGADNVAGTPSGIADQEPPTLAKFRPMNYLLLGSFHAPIAQMLGLYWADETAKPSEHYDYLIIADLNNVGQGDSNKMLTWLGGPTVNFTDIDAWICFDCSLGTPPSLQQPTALKSYALPGTTSEQPDGSLKDMTNNAGLTWHIDTFASGKLQADESAMYLIRRAKLGDEEPANPVPVADHTPISKNNTPHLVTDPEAPSGSTAQRPGDWPDASLYYIDAGLDEGWYSYVINGVDLFGRYSPASTPAAWHQWTPEPDPSPWYYDNGLGNGAVHLHAISLLDKVSPPPPTAVEAFALDPEDPNIIRDAAYNAWFATLSPAERASVIGLRVRWLWTWSHMRQAPDAAEFRVYYEPGQPNVLKGRIAATAPAGATHTTVTTDIAHGEAVNAFANCYMRASGRSFKVTASSAASPLELTVENLAPDDSITPESGARCALTVAPSHPLYLDLSRHQRWGERVWVVPYANAVAEGVMAAPVPGNPEAQLAGENATSAGTQVTFPPGTDISGIRPLHFHVYLAEDTARPNRIYRVHAVNPVTRTVTVDGHPLLAGGISGWELGVRVRRYETFLPVPGDAGRDGLDMPTSTQNPMIYAQLGVTAVDDKAHTGDDPARAGDRWGDRTGNESRVAGPATVMRVHRIPPPPPQMPEDSEAVYASKADYQSKSYYTFRWVPQNNVDAHIFRAMDKSLFQRDWEIRSTRANLSGSAHQAFFPDGWNATRRNNAAAELNAINDPGDYAGLSADGVEVLGRLPGNEGHRSKGTLNNRDWFIRHTRSNLGAGELEFFPPEWGDALKRQAAANLLNAINGFDDYAGLSNDAMRVLAGLPGNETAFQQITDRPLPNIGSKTQNRLGPDNPQGFPIDPALRAYVDALDGRSTNRYFYRAAFMDAAQNIGALGLSSPPVHLPDVLPPRAPVFTRVLAGDPNPMQPGDRKITLRWNSNREADLAAYHVYRTDNEKNARDVRLMDKVHEMAVAAGDPSARPAEVLWLDDTVLGLVTYHYRLVAVDAGGNQSEASQVIAARAFDTALPEVPELTIEWVEQAGIVRAEISWDSPHEVMIQRREGSANWIDLAQWRAPGAVTIRDPFSTPDKSYEYRAQVRKYTGARMRGEANVLEPQA